jgi:putative transposase
MQLTQKIKIKPTIAQELVLNALSERCRLIYNFALEERMVAFKNNIKGINYNKQQNDLPLLKTQYPEYKWVYSKVLQHTLRILDADYKSFFALNKKGDKNARPPKYKGKKYFVTMVHNQSGFKSGKGFIELSHNHPLGTKLWFRIPEQFLFNKIYQITIFKDKDEYYLSVVYEKVEKEFVDNGIIQAFDLGLIKQTAVNIYGKFTEFTNQRPDKYWQQPKQELQSRIDHCKKYSRKWFKLKKQLNYCYTKSSNQLKDSQHKLSRKIIDNTKANTIVVGDLNIKKMAKHENKEKGRNRSLQNTGTISRVVGFLTYKGKIVGKKIIEINEYDTSKTCCLCGKKKDMPLELRQYECDCGNDIDRDKNSAINIMIKYLSQNGMWTSYWQFVSNLRKTGLAIVSHSKEAISSKPKVLGYE